MIDDPAPGAGGTRDGDGASCAPASRPFDGLEPDLILDAVERLGVICDGRMLALNSYENRVYRVGIEDGAPVVVKFYRPARWDDAAIEEEHAFAAELAEREIPVAAPLRGPDGRTLLAHEGFRFAVFPCFGGEWPALDDPDTRTRLGRYVGRIHGVAGLHPFRCRPPLDPETFGERSRRYLLDEDLLPLEWASEYEAVSGELVAAARTRFAETEGFRPIRLHGDCHPGNVLWSPDGPTFVDLDDCRSGPAVQDLWMLLSGSHDEMALQLGDVLAGYRDFCDFDSRELVLIEALRGLRLMHYAAWLARRWDDPAFPRSFPWFGTRAYWAEHVSDLRQQIMRTTEPALTPPWR